MAQWEKAPRSMKNVSDGYRREEGHGQYLCHAFVVSDAGLMHTLINGR